MRAALSVALALTLALVVSARVSAADKEVTLKGTILCAKCKLHETDDCTNAIQVKEDGKDVVYYFDDKGKKESYHKKICQKTAEGSVTGTVSEKDGKKYIKPAKNGVKFD